MVEVDDPGARRHRRARLGDHPAPAHVGGVRPPGRLHRPAGRLARPAASASARITCASRSAGASRPSTPARPGVRPHRGARVQPHVRDVDRAREGRRLDGLPAARDGAGHLPRLQDHAAVRAPQAAVRHRPGRQVVPQRDHARQLHLPHARVRADGDGVLRPARPGRPVVRLLAAGATGLVRLARHRPREAALARPRRGRAVALLLRDRRRRVPVPDRLVGARGRRQPRRLRPHPARQALGREARVFTTPMRASATCRT